MSSCLDGRYRDEPIKILHGNKLHRTRARFRRRVAMDENVANLRCDFVAGFLAGPAKHQLSMYCKSLEYLGCFEAGRQL